MRHIQIATRLPGHCSGPALAALYAASSPTRCCSQQPAKACAMLLIVTLFSISSTGLAASQTAGWYRPTAYMRRPTHPCSKILEKSHYFCNYDPYRHKTQHVLHMVIMHLRATFRHCICMTRCLGDTPGKKKFSK